MNESTARAERYDLQISTSSLYLWEVPQKPVAVRIPFTVMDRLEREAVESFRSLSSRGSEIGGLLIGDVTQGSPLVVSIADFQLIECDYSRGPLYRLSDADSSRFQRAAEQRLASGSTVAGFFRSHTRKGMALDGDDLAFFNAQLREPHQIALLVRPFATKASTAAIFIREGGKINGDASYLEFPFRSSELGGKQSDQPEAGAAPAAPPSTQAQKPAARAQIVPIASRREISIPAPAVEEKPAPAVAPPAKAVAAPPAPPAEQKPDDKQQFRSGKSDRRIEKQDRQQDKLDRQEKEKKDLAVAKQEKAAVAVAPSVSLPAPEEKSSKGLKLVMAALAATALFVALFVYPGLLRNSTKTAPNPMLDASPLQLRVERSNGELLLTWNRDSAAIRTALKAVLVISDGEQHENVDMDLAQLRNGSILYSPQTADISFKMEVTTTGKSKLASESVRVLRTHPSPLTDQSPAAQASAAKSNTPPSGVPATPGQPGDPAASPTAEPAPPESKPVVPLKQFNAQSLSLSQRLRPTSATDLPDAPTAGSAAAAAPIPGVNLNAVVRAPSAPVAPPPVVTPAPTAPVDAKSTPRPGGQIQQAVLISRKDPEYPKLARQTGAKGLVRLTATIGKDGRVKSVTVISGHAMLQSAAKDAVRQWIYKPTLLNGQPVETDTEIQLNFVGDK